MNKFPLCFFHNLSFFHSQLLHVRIKKISEGVLFLCIETILELLEKTNKAITSYSTFVISKQKSIIKKVLKSLYKKKIKKSSVVIPF